MKRWWWQVDFDGGDAALLRFARALLNARGTWPAGNGTGLAPPQRGVTVFAVVELPEGAERAFLAAAKPQRMVPPVRLDIMPGIERDDGHPGRAADWPRRMDPWKEVNR